MTNLSRRSLLIGMASAATVAAGAGTVPGAASAAAPVENPRLLALGDQIPGALAEMLESHAAHGALLRKWGPQWPRVPVAIVENFSDSNCWERDLAGYPIAPDGTRLIDHSDVSVKPYTVCGSEWLAWQVARFDRALNRKRRNPLTAAQIMDAEAGRAMALDRLAMAREYEAAKANILKASGLAASVARGNAARGALAALVTQVMAEPETTMAGVVIKAQAIAAWAQNPMGKIDPVAWGWPAQLATALLRFAGEAPTEKA